MSLLELFCSVDDFCRSFEPIWNAHCLKETQPHRNRARSLALSEIMTIPILFHQSHYRTFKAFYTEHVTTDLRSDFPSLVSYSRFVEFFPSALVPFTLTPGNVDDRVPVPSFAEQLAGKLFGDKGYLSQPLAKALKRLFGVELITPRRRNMKAVEIPLRDKLQLRKRAIVETIIDQLKNISQIEHTRHRSPINFLVNVICGLIAYCHQPKKPSLQLNALPFT